MLCELQWILMRHYVPTSGYPSNFLAPTLDHGQNKRVKHMCIGRCPFHVVHRYMCIVAEAYQEKAMNHGAQSMDTHR